MTRRRGVDKIVDEIRTINDLPYRVIFWSGIDLWMPEQSFNSWVIGQ